MATEVCEECGTRCAVGVPRCPHCSSTRLVPEEQLAALVPSLTVCCTNQACAVQGVQRRVGLVQVVPGVLVLPRLVCARCGYELLKVTEDIVPKITVHGGPSNAAAESEEGEDVSAGISSSTSSETGKNSPESTPKSSDKGRSPARTTESRSKRRPTAGSSARSTDGGQAAGTSATAADA
jgi:hypothetical protein